MTEDTTGHGQGTEIEAAGEPLEAEPEGEGEDRRQVSAEEAFAALEALRRHMAGLLEDAEAKFAEAKRLRGTHSQSDSKRAAVAQKEAKDLRTRAQDLAREELFPFEDQLRAMVSRLLERGMSPEALRAMGAPLDIFPAEVEARLREWEAEALPRVAPGEGLVVGPPPLPPEAAAMLLVHGGLEVHGRRRG